MQGLSGLSKIGHIVRNSYILYHVYIYTSMGDISVRKCYGKPQMFLTFSVHDAFWGPNFDSYRCIFDSYHDISPIVP